MSKKLIVLFAFIFWGSGVIAQTFHCKVTEYAFRHAAVASSMSIDWVKYWFPPNFSVNSQKAQFWKDVIFDVSGGDRVSTFQVKNRDIVNGNVFHDTYYINIDHFSKTAVVRLAAHGYEMAGPVRYTCESSKETKTSPTGGSKINDKLHSEFSKLSNCNKKYLQQFLKGQGLYFGGIDGLWGRGTEKAVEAALKLPTFKNETVDGFFKKIIRNPICN